MRYEDKRLQKPLKSKVMKKIISILIALSLITFYACEENEDTVTEKITDEEEAMVTIDASADNVTEALDYEVDYFTSSTESVQSLGSSYKSTEELGWGRRFLLGVAPEITVEPEGWEFPKTITIDYGDGMELLNGRIISGIIQIELSGPPMEDGATRYITFENFAIDTVQITGYGLRTFTGGVETERRFSCENEFTFTFSDGTVLHRNGERERILAEGFETPYDNSDDLITITGFVNYEIEGGSSFSKTIIDPLIKTGTCRFIVQGVVSFTYNSEFFAELDYGDGTCDDIATITKDGETRQITIGHRRRFWQ